MDTTVVTLRLPSDLVEWVDKRGKRGPVVTEALEALRSPKRFALTEDNLELVRAAVRETLEAVEDVQLEEGISLDMARVHDVSGYNPPATLPVKNMAALRATCAGNAEMDAGAHKGQSKPRVAEEVEIGPSILALCPHKEWAEDGEQYRCCLEAGHKGKCAPGEMVS